MLTALLARARTPRGLAVVGGVLAVVLLAVTLTLVQVRAERAQDARDAAAASAAEAAALELVQQRAAERAEREAREQERREEAQAREEAEAAAARTAWDALLAEAMPAVATAGEVLAASEGKVADDAVRVALADALALAQERLDVAEPPRDAAVRQGASDAVAALVAATQAVSAAVAAVEAERAAADDDARPPARPAERSGGAGPDCGGPDSYEPPAGGSGPVFYTSTPAEDGDGSNGRLPRSAMAPLGWCVDSQGNQQWLRADAAAALTRLNEEFRAVFGENIAVDLTYRSYPDQVAMREAYGSRAAQPGTSNHGWGTAFDTWEWQAYAFGSARYEWLVANGPAHGWVAPAWARQGGSNPEYWHFEYTG